MNFKMIKDADLVSELKTLVKKEREILAQVLEYLQEVELRKIHLAKAYPSLFEFATRELGYTATAAQRRIEAMRLMKSIPEVGTLIESGALSLSVAAQAQSFFKQENKRRSDIKLEKLSIDTKREILESVAGLSSRDCERKLAELSPEAILPKERSFALKGQKTLIQFTADEELMQNLERIKELLSHKELGQRYDALFKEMAKLTLKQLEAKVAPRVTPQVRSKVEAKVPSKKERKVESGIAMTNAAQDSQKAFPTSEMPWNFSKASRYIPAQVRREVYRRDAGRCVHKDPATGKVCGSKYFLQLDHLNPFAWGGEATSENLALRCRNHNLYRADQMGLKHY